VLDGDPAPPKRGTATAPPPFGPFLLRPNGWMDQDELSPEVNLGPGHIVLDVDPAPQKTHSSPLFSAYVCRGTQLPLSQRGTALQFSAHICCGQMAAWIKMALGVEAGVGPGHFVLDGDPAPSPKRGRSPQKWPWIKMVLSMEVGLSTWDFVLDGDPATPSQKGVVDASPIFGPFLFWPNGWMHQDATWYGGRPQPRRLCVRWGTRPILKKGRIPQNFRPMFIVVKRLYGSRWHFI